MAVARNRRLSMLISDEEWAMLQALAVSRGITASDVIRLYIRGAYSDAFGDKPPPKRKR